MPGCEVLNSCCPQRRSEAAVVWGSELTELDSDGPDFPPKRRKGGVVL